MMIMMYPSDHQSDRDSNSTTTECVFLFNHKEIKASKQGYNHEAPANARRNGDTCPTNTFLSESIETLEFGH